MGTVVFAALVCIIQFNGYQQQNGFLSNQVIPGFPGFTGFSGFPGFPGIPGIATTRIPGIPGIDNTGIPGIPGIATTGIPGIPGIDNTWIPGIATTRIPGIPGIDNTGIPGIATTRIPGIPGIDNTGIPGIPGFDTTGIQLPVFNLTNPINTGIVTTDQITWPNWDITQTSRLPDEETQTNSDVVVDDTSTVNSGNGDDDTTTTTSSSSDDGYSVFTEAETISETNDGTNENTVVTISSIIATAIDETDSPTGGDSIATVTGNEADITASSQATGIPDDENTGNSFTTISDTDITGNDNTTIITTTGVEGTDGSGNGTATGITGEDGTNSIDLISTTIDGNNVPTTDKTTAPTSNSDDKPSDTSGTETTPTTTTTKTNMTTTTPTATTTKSKKKSNHMLFWIISAVFVGLGILIGLIAYCLLTKRSPKRKHSSPPKTPSTGKERPMKSPPNATKAAATGGKSLDTNDVEAGAVKSFGSDESIVSVQSKSNPSV
ncbi:mucin-2-like [Oppia nitens]|uniref:mucin-2-like n=1 Tax=Oppia nitens TaxID=1686743 RepID=UPI0023D9CB33|nr:mucin-2-like [Oppia nitens]